LDAFTRVGRFLHARTSSFFCHGGRCGSFRIGRGRKRVERAADRARDGISVEVIKARAALRVLARALRAANGLGRHRVTSIDQGSVCSLPCAGWAVESKTPPQLAAPKSGAGASPEAPG